VREDCGCAGGERVLGVEGVNEEVDRYNICVIILRCRYGI